MKRFLTLFLLVAVILAFTSCTDSKDNNSINKENTNNQSSSRIETANKFDEFTVDVNGSEFKIDQQTMRAVLDVFPKNVTGLNESIEKYNFLFSAETFHSIKGCKAEAYIKNPKKIEGTFLVVGNEFYVFDNEKNDYMLLTEEGRVDVEVFDEKTTSSIEVGDKEQIEEDNNKTLHSKFKGVDETKLNLEKPLSEYKLYVSGATGKYKDKTIYIIDVLNPDNTPTKCRLAFDEKNVYVFDTAKDRFIIAPKTPTK